MEPQRDFKDLFALLNSHNVAYVVVGAYALAFHGAPRFTGDMDICVNSSPENAARIVAALTEFGFGSLALAASDFTQPCQVIQLGVPPVRVDLLTSLTGVAWEEVDAGKVAGHYGDVPVFYLGRDEYIKNKKATGRPKDLADAEALEHTA